MRRVLLVDDQEITLKYLAKEFVRENIEPFQASTQADAVEIAGREHPELAIVDLFLAAPENGLEVVKAIKDVSPTTICILVSAHMTVAHAVLGIRAGADDVCLKPFGARQALDRLANGQPLPEPTALTLRQLEWEHITRVLEDYDGNITRAAAALGIFRQSLQRKIAKHAPRVLRTGPEADKPEPADKPPPKADKPKPKPKSKTKR